MRGEARRHGSSRCIERSSLAKNKTVHSSFKLLLVKVVCCGVGGRAGVCISRARCGDGRGWGGGGVARFYRKTRWKLLFVVVVVVAGCELHVHGRCRSGKVGSVGGTTVVRWGLGNGGLGREGAMADLVITRYSCCLGGNLGGLHRPWDVVLVASSAGIRGARRRRPVG